MPDTTTSLEKIGILALEDWGMMMTETIPSDRELFRDNQDLYLGTIEYSGSTKGKLAVVCDKPFLHTLYCNILGLDEDSDTAEQNEYEDTLKELTNVILGNFLTEAYGAETVFELIHPNAQLADATNLDSFFEQHSIVCIEADEHPVAIALSPND